MDLEEAKILLDGCVRSELRDHAFGDVELFWEKNGKEVAGGYFGGRHADVWIDNQYGSGPESFVFDEDDAQALRNCGTLGQVERNDETGPDEFEVGKTMPGLTKEGVYKELTGQDLVE